MRSRRTPYGYAAGVYRVVLSTNGDPETRLTASIPIAVTNKNVEIVATPATGITLEGRVVAADGSRLPDLTKLTIQLESAGTMVRFTDLIKGTRPSADGKFRLAGVPAANHWLSVIGLSSANDIKEIGYNGARLANIGFGNRLMVVPLDASSVAHSVTIVIDDKPASIAGTVMDGDQPADKPYLILAKWPPATTPYRILSSVTAMGDESAQTWSAKVASADANGQFRFSGLAPGEYHIIALRTRTEDEKRAPGSLERALAGAPKIEIGAGAFQNLTLDLTMLR